MSLVDLKHLTQIASSYKPGDNVCNDKTQGFRLHITRSSNKYKYFPAVLQRGQEVDSHTVQNIQTMLRIKPRSTVNSPDSDEVT